MRRRVPAENSLLRFASEDKAPGEDFLLGRSLSQNRRKTERGGSPTHYALVPALQMEVSLSTSSSDSASLYHVSACVCVHLCVIDECSSARIHRRCVFLTLQVFERSSLLSRSKKKSKGERWRRALMCFKPKHFVLTHSSCSACSWESHGFDQQEADLVQGPGSGRLRGLAVEEERC